MDYVNCTLEELVSCVETTSSARISQALAYHSVRNNESVVAKIKEARKIVRKRKMLKAISEM